MFVDRVKQIQQKALNKLLMIRQVFWQLLYVNSSPICLLPEMIIPFHDVKLLFVAVLYYMLKLGPVA